MMTNYRGYRILIAIIALLLLLFSLSFYEVIKEERIPLSRLVNKVAIGIKNSMHFSIIIVIINTLYSLCNANIS